jgi:prepilin-type N-terminal cleavage/methylation domain-containing protein
VSVVIRLHLLRDERGFTLPEMMVTIMVMIMVLFALYSIFDMSLRVFSFGNDKVEAAENARLGLEKMEREIRAAYPYDTLVGKDYVLLSPSDPTLAASVLSASEITFGNDLNGDNKLGCPVSGPCEFITYKVSSSAPYTLQRVNTATPNSSPGEPVVEFVNGPGGLAFTYLKPDASGTLVTTATPSEVKVVRVRLQISKNGRTQTLTTDITLRNKGF